MRMHHRLAAVAAVVMVCAATTATSAMANPPETLLPATELTLPRFHAEALEADVTAADILFDEKALWIVGDSSLWVWRPEERKLSRMRLHDPRTDGSPLTTIASDGVSLFAASRATIYQIARGDHRVFRYRKLPRVDRVASRFLGRGDDFWWVAAGEFFKLDRYGKTISPHGSAAALVKARGVSYLPEGNALFWTDGRRLLRGTPGNSADAKVILTAKDPLLGLQAASDHLVAHTAHTVLRLALDGSVRQAIPVEGRRKLVTMHIGADRHAYLFDDQLLEVFDLKTQTAQRFALPLDGDGTVRRLTVAWPLAAIATANGVRVFRLGSASPASPGDRG